MKRIITFIIVLLSLSVFSQKKLSLKECQNLVHKNYPLSKKSSLLAKQNDLDIAVINTAKLPKLEASAQATYQSDVIELPISIPNFSIESPNNDQYKAMLSLNQLIYDGGLINASTDVKKATLKTQQQEVKVNLYQLKKQVNQLYFSIVLLQEKRSLLTAKETLLTTKLKEVKAGVEYGVLLPTSDKTIEAELLKITQQFIEIDQNKISLVTSLSKLIGEKISSTIILESPIILMDFDGKIQRPELELFQLQKKQIEASEKVIAKKNSPKLLGFATGGYGNPGLNMLDNSFQPYYMIGAKLNWTVFDGNATKKQRKSLQVNKELIDNQQEIFQLNTNIELEQQQSEITKISAFITSDNTIINLREEILKSAEAQLKNGVITSSAYITELTNLHEAKNILSTHKIKLQLAKANYKTTKGIPSL